jgi:hypothetical protein
VKVGAENRTKLITAVALLGIAGVLAGSRFAGSFGGGSSSAAAPLTMPSPDFSANTPPSTQISLTKNRNPGKKQALGRSLDPTLRFDLLRASEDTKYEGTGRNIFKVFVEIPKPITPVAPQPVRAQGPPPPPPPPPINLKFYGFATPTGGVKRVFLADGEDVFIAKEGEIVDRRYKVVRISPNSVEILDVLSNNRQNIPLMQG